MMRRVLDTKDEETDIDRRLLIGNKHFMTRYRPFNESPYYLTKPFMVS